MGKPLHRMVVPETSVRLLYEYLEGQGLAPEAVLGEPWPEPQPHGLGGFPVERWVQLLNRAAAALDDPLLGLHLGRTIEPRHLGVLGYVLLACDTLGAALQRLERYQRLVFDVATMRSRLGPGWVELTWDQDTEPLGRLLDETGITMIVQFCRSMAGDSCHSAPLAVHFMNPAPPNLQPYLDYFGCPVLFDQPETILRVSLQALSLQLRSADPGLVAAMERHADELMAQLPQEDALIENVRKQIARLLHDGEPDIRQVAARLHCASRTLQRRLREAGTSFRAELALVRRRMAESYLRDPRLQIVDIAPLLGYSEHSAFTRSYKEWTGQTPQQWRQKQGATAMRRAG